MILCDLHCDTATVLYHLGWKLADNERCAVSLKKASVYDKYIQCAAVFTSTRCSDEEGWEQFFRVRRYFLDECDKTTRILKKKADELVQYTAEEAAAEKAKAEALKLKPEVEEIKQDLSQILDI